MAETEKTEELKVNDRRRFDRDGNLRSAQPEGAGEGAQTGEAPPTAGEAAPPAPAAPPEGVAALEQELERTRQELGASRARVDELARAYQALLREREEFKQRLTRERERLLDVERANVAQVLLQVVDELDLCLKASVKDESPLARGVRLIREGVLAKLQASGIERLEVVGKPFDPNVAEASDTEVTADPAEDQKVVAEIRAGYRLKERVIRPSRVKVARYVEPAQA